MIKIVVPDSEPKPGEKIPRIIHYCWFGGKPLPFLARKCIKSWKKHLPDYRIICWNEKSFDVYAHPYTREAYETKKWAFITDYVRLYVLFEYGGVYLDSDVEIIKPIDKFLRHSAFSSFESPYHIPTGLMASSKQNIWIKNLLDYYENKHFLNPEGEPDLTPNTVIITNITKEKHVLLINNLYQRLPGDLHIYPTEFFCPMNWEVKKIQKTFNTYSIHHFAGSWIEGKSNENYIKMRKKARGIVLHILGKRMYDYIGNNTWRKIS